MWAPADASELRITEMPTGRTTTIAVRSTGIMPDEIAIARKLAVTPLVGGQGTAIAYFPTCPLQHPDAVATLTTAPQGAVRNVELLPGSQLALAPPRASSDR